MARRYLPILLAARMKFRLHNLQEALEKADQARAEREARELGNQWTQFGHVARESHSDLWQQIDMQVKRVSGLQPEALHGSVEQLHRLLRDLAG